MNEKAMVIDTLMGINGELRTFEDYITQTENPQLKQTLKQFRNECEMSQEKLYQTARQHSYYVPAAMATQQEIEHVKSVLSQPSMQ
ncbi:MAG: spore coat protein [Ruminococcus sp.]|jgi:spore coat protein CotF